jgi:hypothetical protein
MRILIKNDRFVGSGNVLGSASNDAFRRPEALVAMRARAHATAREMSLDHLDRLEPLLAADRQSYAHFTGR